jgi:nucleoside-diphosphate-sugar epimerase
MDHPSVIVLGANGRFGRAATEAFAAAGWRVLAQLRRAPVAPLPAGAQALSLPLADTGGLATAAAGASTVVYAINPAYTHWHDQLLPMAGQGMDLAQRLGAHFMLPGNVYAYGESMPARLDEQTPERATTAKGRLRQRLEAELAERGQTAGQVGQAGPAGAALRSTVIRAGDFYGCGTGSWLDLIIAKNLARGRLSYPGPLDLAHAWAYLPDLARAFVAVAARPPAAAGLQRLHFAGHTLTGGQLLDAVEAAAGDLGLRPAGGWRRRTMPWWPLRLAAPFWPMGRELLQMAYLWRVPHALDGQALQRAVGPLPGTAPRTALRESLQALGFGADAAGLSRAASRPGPAR